jgi:chaperonin GroES
MLKPLGNRVLLEPMEEEELSPGGIVLPDSAKKRPQQGKVLAVGPGRTLDSGELAPMTVKVGDVVVYSEFGGTELKVGDKEYVIIEEDSLLALREEDAKKKKKKGRK